MRESDGEDSLLIMLIEDVENAAAEGCCGYFGKRKCESCDECPARDVDDPCDAIVYGELARRLHALMPHDTDGREIKAGDVLTEHCHRQGTEYFIEGFRVVPTTKCNVCITHAPTLRVVHPDSWERLEQDAALLPHDYLTAKDASDRRYGTEALAAMSADLVRRAKALAGVEQ